MRLVSKEREGAWTERSCTKERKGCTHERNRHLEKGEGDKTCTGWEKEGEEKRLVVRRTCVGYEARGNTFREEKREKVERILGNA